MIRENPLYTKKEENDNTLDTKLESFLIDYCHVKKRVLDMLGDIREEEDRRKDRRYV